MQQRPTRLAAAGSRAAPVAAAVAAATADVHRHPLQPPPAPAPGLRPQAARAPLGHAPGPGPAPAPASAAPLVHAHAHAHAAVPAADLKRTVSIGELHAAAPGPDARPAALRGRAPKPRYYSQEMLSSAGSSTESSGCTESSSKTSLHSAESTEARARPAPCPTPTPTSASASLFFRSEREHSGLRPHAPALRPFVARPAPLRPASLADRQASALAKGPLKDQGTLKKPKKDARRAEIVAAVTKRLYTTKKKPEASTDEAPTPEPAAVTPASASAAADDEEEPEELKLCARARAKLQELSRRALGTGGRRARPPLADADVQTDFPRHTTRVKEKAVETDPRTLCVADAAVGTRDSPPRVLRVREVGTGPEGVDASVGTLASPTHAHSAHSSSPPQPPTKDANVQLDSAASQQTDGDRRKFDSNCFDCYLQSAAEGVSSDGPYILADQGTKTKSNQCNLFDGLQESKEVAVGVIPHVGTAPDWAGQNQSRDVAVCTDKCFYHTQLQKYAGVTAVPSPTVRTTGSDALSCNNCPVYSCATERTNQLPIRDRLTNNIHGSKDKEEIQCRLPGYLKTFRPRLSPTDTYKMRKSLGTQTLSNRLGNIHFSRESPHKWQTSDYISSHLPKKYKNFENQISRTEHCCHTYPNNLLYKQIDECFSDDSLDSCKSGDCCLEPDSLNDIQTYDSFNQYRYNCLSRKDRLPNSFCTNSSHFCPVHNKVIHCTPHSRRQRMHHNNASRVDMTSFHSCNSINKHRDGKLQVDLGSERCNIHREDRTCEKHPRKLRPRREHRDMYEYKREDILGKMNNTYPVFMSSSSPSKSTTLPRTQILETNSNLRSWSNSDPTKPVVNIQTVSAQSQQNIPTRAQDEINTKQYFTVNDTPLYTFTKCNSGYMAKEVTSLTMSPINFQLTTTHFQATQTIQGENEVDRQAQTESHDKNSNTTLKKKLNDEPQSSPSNISALLCAECSEKISSFTEDVENKSSYPNAQNSNLIENDISITENSSNSFLRCNSKEAVMPDIKIKEKSKSKGCSFHDNRENLFTSKESVLPANIINDLSNQDLPSNITRNKSESISMCNHNSQQKADLYSIIAYNQTYDHLNISSRVDPVEETNNGQKENITFSPENLSSIKKNHTVHNQDEKSHYILSSLQQIKECIQRIENNISKYYQAEIDAESSQSETPTEITSKWVFNKTLQTNDVSISKESEACRFETLITLNKQADITPNWKGLLKVSKVSPIKMSNDVKEQHDSSNQYVHVKNNTDTIDDNSKLGTYTGDEQKDTNIGIEIEINDTQLKTGSITFGKNYTSFDTKVQNFKLLLMLCGNLINIQSPISMQHVKETQQTYFPENTVITFTFEDGGYQPLLNVVVKQSISQSIAHDVFEGKHSGLTTQDEENGDDKPTTKENDISGHKSDGKKKVISNETGINLLPSSSSDKLNYPLSNNVKTNSTECALAKPHVQITSNTARSTDESLIAGSASDSGIINTQPSINGNSIINHKCSNSKTKHTKTCGEGKSNAFNALFLKKSIKRKKRCTPLSTSSCMWNFSDRQSLQEESDTTTSRTCSTLSTFIKKANSLLTRLNEVSTMLDKSKKKSDSDTSVLVTDQNPGQSDEEVDKLQVTSGLLSNYSMPVEELANKPIATISKNYCPIPSNLTLSRHKLHPKLSSSLLSEISCSENNSSQRSHDTTSVPYNSPVHQNKSTPLLSFKDYEVENNDSVQALFSSRELNSNEEQKQQKNENKNICSRQLSESQTYTSNVPFTSIPNENKSQWNYNTLSTSVDSDIRSNVSCERNKFNHRQDKLNSYHYKTNDSCSCNSQVSTTCGRIWQKMCSSAESLPHRNVETSYIPKSKIRNNYQGCNQHCFSLSSQTYAGNELKSVPKEFCTSTHSMHVPHNIVISEQSKYNHEKSKSFSAQGSYKSSPISRSCHSHFSSDTNNSLVPGKYLSNQSCSFTNYTKPQKLSSEYTSHSENDMTEYISGINRTHIKSKMINTPVYRNTSHCPTCINLQNTNVVPSDNKTAIANTKKVVRGKSVVPSTDIVHSSGYISSILPSPRAYMHYLLHLRRQIVVASGLDTSFNYTSFTQNDV